VKTIVIVYVSYRMFTGVDNFTGLEEDARR